MSLKIRSSVAALGLLLAACSAQPTSSSSTDEVRSITNAEALADFDQMANAFRGMYGALERKEQRYGFEFEKIVVEYRARVAASKSEPEAMGVYQEFLARFQDAHISLSTQIESNDSYSYALNFRVMPVGDSYVVYVVGQGAETVKRGEELLAINGVSTADMYTEFQKYQSVPNELAKKHFTATTFTYRQSYQLGTTDYSKPAKLSIRGLDGATREVEMDWGKYGNLLVEADEAAREAAEAPVPQGGQSGPENTVSASPRALEVIRSELNKQGSRVPFFMTPQVRTALNVTEVTPSFAQLVKHKISAEQAAKVNYFAGKYVANGKRILVLRIPHYSPTDANIALAYIRALLEEQAPQVDGLVVDDGHNPGGNIAFATGLLGILAKTQLNGYVQRMHADRLWLGTYSYWANYESRPDFKAVFLDYAHDIDKAYTNGEPLSGPIPFYRKDNFIQVDTTLNWKKPVMMLQDSLSVSCADLVPLVFKRNKIGQTFGETTMGGGGSVEEVANLVNTQASLSISRGVGTVFDPTGVYPEEDIIEDNGVPPTVPFTHTLEDFRAGYIGYVTAFNKVMTDQIAAETAAPAAQ